MSKLVAADYETVLDLIEAVSAAPKVPGASNKVNDVFVGFSVDVVLQSYRLLFPASTLTDGEVIDVLQRAGRSGVFRVIASNAGVPGLSCCEILQSSEPRYSVNQQMVRVNPANRVYAQAFNGPSTSTATGVYSAGYPIDPVPLGSFVASAGDGNSLGQVSC